MSEPLPIQGSHWDQRWDDVHGGTQTWHECAATPPQPSAGLRADDWMRPEWTEIIRLVSDGLTYCCPYRDGECGGYTDHGNEAHRVVRAALSAAKPDAGREAVKLDSDGEPVCGHACGMAKGNHGTGGVPSWLGHRYVASASDAGRGAIDVERLYRVILAELVVLWGEPSDAVSVQVRPIVARNIAAAYADAAGEAVSDADAYQWETKAWSVSGFTQPDSRLDAIRERVRRADGFPPQAVADRAYLLGLVDGTGSGDA